MYDFGIYYNRESHEAVLAYASVCNHLQSIRSSYCLIDEDHILNCKCLIVFGGDGTILRLAVQAAKCNIPILSFNCGHVGYLAEFETAQIAEAIDLAMSDTYPTLSRSLVLAKVDGREFYALNEINLSHRFGEDGSCVATIGVSIDGNPVDTYRGDGVIVCTPTGSTAYSLSAGGSILHPELNALMVTPICSHSLHSRPIVFPDSSVVTLDLSANRSTVSLFCDGKFHLGLTKHQTVTVTAAPVRATFIKNEKINFYHKLLAKIH